MLDYIPNEYARDWVSLDQHDGIFVPRAFIYINEGQLTDAHLFSQIVYWHKPTEAGKPKLQLKRAGHYWLAKNHGDWYDECGIPAGTVRKCLKRLQERKLIIYELHGFNGNPTPWIRVNWDEFERRMLAWEAGIDMKMLASVPTGYSPCADGSGGCSDGSGQLTQQVDSNTETTTENTPDNTTEDLINNNHHSLVVPDAHLTGEGAFKDAELRNVISEIWDTTAPGRIQELKKTLLGQHPVGSEHYESNVKPPAIIEDLRALENFYRRMNPDKKMPTAPEKIQDWLYTVRGLVPAYWVKKGYSIELHVKVPEKVTRNQQALGKHLQDYYPEEWQRIQYLCDQLAKHPPTANEYRSKSIFKHRGEDLVVQVPIPFELTQWDEIADYLEANHPYELKRLYHELDRIDARRQKELDEILMQG